MSRSQLKNLKRGNLVFDGAIVALDEQGRASSQESQNRKSTRRPIMYYLFDLLHSNGNAVRFCSVAEFVPNFSLAHGGNRSTQLRGRTRFL